MKIKVKRSELEECVRNAVTRLLNESLDEICFSTVDDDPDELVDFYVGSKYHGDDDVNKRYAAKRAKAKKATKEIDDDEVVRQAMKDKRAQRAATKAIDNDDED